MDKHPSPNLFRLLKDTTCLLCAALPMPQRSVCNITAGERVPARIPGASWGKFDIICGFCKLMKTDPQLIPVKVAPTSFYQLPAWIFVRCTGTGELQSCLSFSLSCSLSLCISVFLFETQRGLATFRSVWFCESYFSKLCSQPLKASV